MEKIHTQLLYDLEKFNVEKGSITSLFIGGGTPSTIPPYMYENFFKALTPFLAKNAEITSEANPNSASKEWIKGMRDLGVNRLSFGVQSFFEDKLKFLGRNHTSKQAKLALENAFEAGIKNLSLDLIYGTTLDTQKRLLLDIEEAFKLPINHISSYSLTIEKDTPFESKDNVQNDSDELARFFADEITSRGFHQYEISNFGTYTCKHNLGYWKHENYLGIGCGAVGFSRKTRYYPHILIEKYIEEPLFRKEESLHVKDLALEKIFLGFRSDVGVDISILDKKQLKKVSLLEKEAKIFLKNDRLFNYDFFLADELALFLMN